MRSASRFDTFINDRGHPLLGTTDMGLGIQDALSAVRLAREEGIPILGGDVYRLDLGKMRPAYLNWCTEPLPGEAEADYARRSWEESEMFIHEVSRLEDVEPVIVLVRAM